MNEPTKKNKEIIDKIQNDFDHFKKNILDVQDELNKISQQILEFINDADAFQTFDYYFGNYYPIKYGEEATHFLKKILESPKEIPRFIRILKNISAKDKAEIELFAYKHNDTLQSIYLRLEHPHALLNLFGVTDENGNQIFTIKRADQSAFSLHLDPLAVTKVSLSFLEAFSQTVDIARDEFEITELNKFLDKFKEKIDKIQIQLNNPE
jgi:hypothetical protein